MQQELHKLKKCSKNCKYNLFFDNNTKKCKLMGHLQYSKK